LVNAPVPGTKPGNGPAPGSSSSCIFEQEFVIGGYTDPEGGWKYFGSLLVGFYEGKNLKFSGSGNRL